MDLVLIAWFFKATIHDVDDSFLMWQNDTDLSYPCLDYWVTRVKEMNLLKHYENDVSNFRDSLPARHYYCVTNFSIGNSFFDYPYLQLYYC